MNTADTFSPPAAGGLRQLLHFAGWPIRAKLTLLFSLGLIGMAAAVGGLMFFTANTLIVRQAEATLDRQNEIVAGDIDDLSAKASSDLLLARQNVAFNQLYLTADQTALEAIQQQLLYLQNRFAIDEICVIAASGAEMARCVQGSLAGLDQLSPNETGNPFFAPTLALADGEVYRSSVPYVSPDTHRWVVAHATPIVLPDGTKAGIFHFEIPLAWFAAKVESNALAGGYSFLMTLDGHLLVHPQLDEFRRAAGIDTSNPDQADFPAAGAWGSEAFHKLVEQMKSGPAGRGIYRDGQETYDVVYQPVFGGHWVVATVLPQSVIYQPIGELLTRTVIVTVPLLLLAVGFLLWYTARLVAPIIRLTDVARQITAGDLSKRVRVESKDEVGMLADTFNRMTGRLRETLKGLEHRTRDLTLVAKLTQKLSTVRDLDELLSTAVDGIGEGFDLYYTQIYLADAAGATLVMRAGTGTVGETLKQNSFRLPISASSINGTAVLEKRAVIVEDTTASPIFRPNPLLPNTRSEMAVPLIVGETVLGVLDLQSDRPEALTSDLAPGIQTLASQLAIAIENADLFARAEQARMDMEAQAKRLTESGWQNFLSAIERSERIGYIYSAGRIESFSATTAASEPASLTDNALSLPISVTNVPVGEIVLEGEREWTEEERELVSAVARQVSQQIENLRLLAQAESYRLEAEQAARRLTREGWQEYAAALTVDGYVYDLNQVSPLTAEAEAASTSAPAFQQPLAIRDEVIGELELSGVTGRTDGAADLVAAVANQLSAHIENLRLTQKTQIALSETEEQARRLAHLNELGQELTRASNMEEIMKAAATSVGQIIYSDRSSIVLLTEDREHYRTMALSGDVAYSASETIYPLAGTTAGMAAKERRPVIVIDPDLNILPNMQRFVEQGLRSFVNAPLISGGKVIGTLNIASLQPGTYKAGDENLLLQVASLLASTLENRRLFEQTQQRSKEMEILNNVSQKLISESDLETLLKVVGDTICNNLDADQGYIGLYDAVHEQLEFPYYSVDRAVVATRATSLGTGANALVIQKRQPLLINREIDRRMMTMGSKTMDFSRRPKVWLGVPILAGQDQDPIGLISIQSRKHEDVFDEDTVRLLTTIAASLSTAIQNLRSFANTRKRADREALVNAINQRIQSTTSVPSAMQTAIEELGRAFKVRRAVVQLGLEKPEAGNGHASGHGDHGDHGATVS